MRVYLFIYLYLSIYLIWYTSTKEKIFFELLRNWPDEHGLSTRVTIEIFIHQYMCNSCDTVNINREEQHGNSRGPQPYKYVF